MTGFVTLPLLNADSEHAFSNLGKESDRSTLFIIVNFKTCTLTVIKFNYEYVFQNIPIVVSKWQFQ